MSTILDALRKAQDETGEPRTRRVAPLPDGVPPPPRRPRRSRLWIVSLVLLVAAFAGGLALGDRLGALFGSSTPADAPAPVAVAGDAAESPGLEQAKIEQAQPEQVKADGLPAPRVAAVPTKSSSERTSRRERADRTERPRGRLLREDRLAAARAERRERASRTASARDASVAAQPTPMGQLEIIEGGKDLARKAAEERAERLKQLRERMLEARRAAQERAAARPAKAPIPIIVPPSANGSGATGGEATAAAPPQDRVAAVPAAPSAPPRPEAPAPSAAESAAPQAETTAPFGVRAAAELEPESVGVPPAVAEAPGAEAPAVAPAPVGSGAGQPEQPVEVAAVQPSSGGEPPVLRRTPGDAPQVSINILQWSSEPSRRFAFVTVDGGNMRQIREGDRIGSLTVKRIYEQMIEFGYNDSTFRLRAN
ncbi:MAG TPA: hypothetical protein VIS07_07055 [Candidatus Binatia bacterium]